MAVQEEIERPLDLKRDLATYAAPPKYWHSRLLAWYAPAQLRLLWISRRRAQGLRAFDPLALAGTIHRLPEIAAPLYVQPEIRAVAEHAGKNERGRSGHVATVVAQLVDV